MAKLLRLAYLGVTNALPLLRLLPMSDRDKDAEILALPHQITVLERQLHGEKIRFARTDRASLAALLRRVRLRVLRLFRGGSEQVRQGAEQDDDDVARRTST